MRISTLRRSLLLAFLALAAITRPVQSQTLLENRSPENREINTSAISGIEQKLMINGQTIHTKVNINAKTKSKFGTRDASGKIDASTQVTSLKAELALPAPVGKITFDSDAKEKGDASNPITKPIFDSFKQLAEMKATFKLDSNLDVTEWNSESSILNADGMSKQYKDAADWLPKEPVKPGDVWRHERIQSFGQGQSLKFVDNYKFEGPFTRSTVKGTQELAKITGSCASIEFAKPTDGKPAPGGEVKSSELKVTKSTFVALFDPREHRIIETRRRVYAEGKLVISAMGIELPATCELDIELNESE